MLRWSLSYTVTKRVCFCQYNHRQYKFREAYFNTKCYYMSFDTCNKFQKNTLLNYNSISVDCTECWCPFNGSLSSCAKKLCLHCFNAMCSQSSQYQVSSWRTLIGTWTTLVSSFGIQNINMAAYKVVGKKWGYLRRCQNKV